MFPRTRSQTIATLVRTIQVAAEHQPAPDLIVLPDCHHCASEGHRPGTLVGRHVYRAYRDHRLASA